MKKLFFVALIFSFTRSVSAQPEAIIPSVNWVNKNAIPIKSVHAETGFDDLAAIDQSIGDARIVALGECTHGSSEIFSMKHRMLEYLVKKKGFTIFSIEASMPEAYALNEYIIDGKGDAKKLLSGMYFWTWNTQEVLDMIEWMKKYNETAARKIMFTGFDMQFTNKAVSNLKNYLQSAAPDLLYLVNDYDSAIQANISNKKYRKELYPLLKNKANELMTKLSGLQMLQDNKDFKWAFQNAKILWQYGARLEYEPMNDKGLRDKSMAENVEWIAEQNPGAKIMIWAHNGHIQKEKDRYGEVRMGNYLFKQFGKDYLAVGFSTEEGTYTAVKQKDNKLDSANVLTASKKSAAEFIFKYASSDNFLIDLHKAKQGEEGSLWVFGKINMRELGAGTNDKFQFNEHQPIRDYDMIIFLKKTTSSKCFNVK